MDRLLIFDTTLRNGDQTFVYQMNTVDKIQMAKALETLGVEVIMAGFPAASSGEFKQDVEIPKAAETAINAINKLEIRNCGEHNI